MYKLYTDKIENFEAKIKLQGASLKKSKARLVVESEGFSLMFNGTITSDGKVKVPVKRLKGLIEENSSGTIKLEVIAEDTLFVPWKSKFEVEQSKKVTVEIKSQNKKSIIKESSAEIISQPTTSEKQHIVNIVKMLIKENINFENLTIKKDKLNNIIAEYVQGNPIKNTQRDIVIEKVVKVLEKRK